MVWFKSLVKYLTATQEQKTPLFASKSALGSVRNLQPELQSSISKYKFNNPLAYFYTYDAADVYLALNKIHTTTEQREAARKQFQNSYQGVKTFYTQDRVISFANFTYNQKKIGAIRIIDKAYTVPLGKNAAGIHHYFFNENVNNTPLDTFIDVVQLRSGYIVATTKNETTGDLRLVKFNDLLNFKGEKPDKVAYIFELNLSQSLDFIKANGGYSKIAINESYTNDNDVDVLIYTKQNTLWYGQVDSNAINSQLQQFKINTFIKLGKTQHNTNNYEITNLKSMLISTLTKKINNKEELYGNIVLATKSGNTNTNTARNSYTMRDKVYNPTSSYSHTPLPDLFGTFRTADHGFTHLNNQEQTLYEMNIREEFLKYFSNLNGSKVRNVYWSNQSKIIIQLDNKIGVEYDRQWVVQELEKRNSSFGYIPKYKPDSLRISTASLGSNRAEIYSDDADKRLQLNLSSSVLNNLLKTSRSNNNLRISAQIINNTTIRYRTYIQGDLIATNDFNFSSPNEWYMLPDKALSRASVMFDISAEVDEEQLNLAGDQVFKLVFRNSKENSNGLIFEIDRRIENVQDTKEGLILANNEIVLPVKHSNRWHLYLFDNDTQIDDQNLIVRQPAKRIGTYPAGSDNIRLISTKEFTTSHPVLFSILDDNKIHIFNRVIGDTSNENIYFDITLPLPNNYYFRTWSTFIYKEQNIIKFLIFTKITGKEEWAFFNVKYDGKPYNLNNYPFLYKGHSKFNTLKENLKVSTVESNNLYFSANVRDIIANGNRLTISADILSTSLNLANHKNEIDRIKWLDNNGNVVFEYADNIGTKTKRDNIRLNFHKEFNFLIFPDSQTNKYYSEKLASVFVNQNNADDMRLSHIRFKYRDGDKVKTKTREIGVQNVVFENNDTEAYFVGSFAILKGANDRQFYDFEIGDADQERFHRLDYIPPVRIEASSPDFGVHTVLKIPLLKIENWNED